MESTAFIKILSGKSGNTDPPSKNTSDLDLDHHSPRTRHLLFRPMVSVPAGAGLTLGLMFYPSFQPVVETSWKEENGAGSPWPVGCGAAAGINVDAASLRNTEDSFGPKPPKAGPAEHGLDLGPLAQRSLGSGQPHSRERPPWRLGSGLPAPGGVGRHRPRGPVWVAVPCRGLTLPVSSPHRDPPVRWLQPAHPGQVHPEGPGQTLAQLLPQVCGLPGAAG